MFGHGADDSAHVGGKIGPDQFLQPLPFLLVFDAAGHGDIVAAGQQHQIASGQRGLHGHPGALGAGRLLEYLDDDVLALFDQVADGTVLIPGSVLRQPAAVRGDGVFHVEEAVLFQADIDEGGLHAGKHVLHLAQVDVAQQMGVVPPGQGDLVQTAVFQQGHRDFGPHETNQHVFTHLYHILKMVLANNQSLTFKVGAGRFYRR